MAATGQADVRLENRPPTKSETPYDAAASSASRTAISGATPRRPRSATASSAATSSIRMLTPTALSACRVDGQRRRRRRDCARRRRSRPRSRRTTRRPGSRRTRRAAHRPPITSVDAGTPLPSAGGPARRTSRPLPIARKAAATAKTSHPAEVLRGRSPRAGWRRGPRGPGEDRHHDAERGRPRARAATMTGARHAGSLPHGPGRDIGSGPGPWSGAVSTIVVSAVGASAPRGRWPASARACAVSSCTLAAIVRSLSPCSRAWWAQKSSSPPDWSSTRR